MVDAGETIPASAKRLGVSRSTIKRWRLQICRSLSA